jgi:SPP1 gp7 family putative phage head morphogenesis protein
MTALLEAPRRSRMQRDLQAAMIDVWVQLDSLDEATQRRILQRTAEMRAEVLDRLSSLETTTDEDGNETWQSTSLRSFEAELRRVASEFASRLATDLTGDLERAAGLADVGYRDALSNLARGLEVPTPLITLSPLGLSSDLVQAATLYNASAFRGLGERVAVEVNREIQRVVFGGQSRWDAVRNIREMLAADPKWAGQKLPPKTLGKLTSYATMVERTAVMSVFNIAADRAYREALDELPELRVEWMTVKDSRVDAACVALHGKRKDPQGTFPGGVIAPPLHPRCRCRTVAWMPGWASLGVRS